MAKFTAKFCERTILVLQYAINEKMKKMRYHDMLRDDIREFVSISGCKTLNDMISRVRDQFGAPKEEGARSDACS